LFVHGLGEQRRADTLIQCGEALQQWLEGWLHPESAHPVRIALAELTDTGGQTPANAVMRITTPAIESTWVLAESWWAESFRAPNYADLWRWSIEVVPLAVADHFVRRFRQARGLSRKALEGLLATVAVVMLPVLTVVTVTSLVIGVLPIARLRAAILRLQKTLLGTVGDSYALLESSIRGSAMSSCVQRDLKWLQSVAGKTVIVAHSQGAAVAHAALRQSSARPDLLFTFGSGLRKLFVLDAVRGSDRFIAWLPALGLALMATGSWLGYRLFIDPTTRVDVFTLAGMEVLGRVSQTVGFDVVGWRSFIGAGAIVGAALGIAAGEGSVGERVIIAGVMALMGTCFALLMRTLFAAGPAGYMAMACVIAGALLLQRGFMVADVDRTNAIVDERLKLDPPVAWTDRYATSDPVPNGVLTTTRSEHFESRPVCNLASPFLDHSSYWKNKDEFVSSVACAIAGAVGLDLTAVHEWDGERLLRAGARRRWRVWWLGLARLVTLGTGLALAQRFRFGPWHQAADAPGPVGVVLGEVVDLVEKIPFLRLLVSEWSKSAVVQVLWPVSLIVLVWLLYRLLFALWSWWDQYETQVLFDRGDYSVASVPFITLLAVMGAVIAVSIGLAAFLDHEVALVWARDPGIRAIRTDLWRGLAAAQQQTQGTIAATSMAIVASLFPALAVIIARSWWRWGVRPLDSQSYYMATVGYTLLAFAAVAPAAWYLFDPLGAPPSPPYPWLLSWNGLAALPVLALIGALATGLVSLVLLSPLGCNLAERLYRGSAAGPLGIWLGRVREDPSDSTIPQIRRRTEQMLQEWSALDFRHRTVTVTHAYDREAISLVRVLMATLPMDQDRVLALSREFPGAALTVATLAGVEDPPFARRVLQPHRETAPRGVRRQIRAIEKDLAAAGTQPA